MGWRLALNETLGFRANRPWLHRLKYGVSFRLPADATPPPSATFVLGPFGEVVTYGDGLIYLTWYPECMQAISTDVTPPDWDTYPPEPLRSRILTGTFHALSAIVPSLRDLDPESLPEACVKGGAIVAWGKTDIYDPASELHRRFRDRCHFGRRASTPSIPESSPWRRTSRKSVPSGLVPPANCTEGDASCRHRALLWECQSTKAPISSAKLWIACSDRRSAISKPSSLSMAAMKRPLLPVARFLSDPRFRMIVHPERLDWVGNFNWLLKQDLREFFCYRQHDDITAPDFFEVLLRAADKDPNAAAIYCDCQFTGISHRY